VWGFLVVWCVCLVLPFPSLPCSAIWIFIPQSFRHRVFRPVLRPSPPNSSAPASNPPSLPFIQILEAKRTRKTDTCALTLHCSRPALISFQDITLLAQRAVEQCRVPWMQGAIAHATGEAEWWVTISTPGKVGVARGIGFEGVGR